MKPPGNSSRQRCALMLRRTSAWRGFSRNSAGRKSPLRKWKPSVFSTRGNEPNHYTCPGRSSAQVSRTEGRRQERLPMEDQSRLPRMVELNRRVFFQIATAGSALQAPAAQQTPGAAPADPGSDAESKAIYVDMSHCQPASALSK